MQLNFYLYDISNYYNIDNKENMIKQVRSISLKGSLIWKNYYDGCTGLSYNGDITFHTLCWINTNEAQSKIFSMILSSVLLSFALIIKQFWTSFLHLYHKQQSFYVLLIDKTFYVVNVKGKGLGVKDSQKFISLSVSNVGPLQTKMTNVNKFTFLNYK